MNPNEANPIAPTGDGTAPVPGAGSMDFTNPANLDAGNGSVMGGAVDNADAGSTNIDGTASGTITQMQPLVPADPVPGSIGSVTSVPPLAPEPMDVSAPANNVTTSNMPVMGQAAESKPAEGTPTTGGSPYYNPFTRNSVNNSSTTSTTTTTENTMTSSTAVPTALQPKTDMFSEKLKGVTENKKSGHTMTLVGWLLAALFLVTTIVFVVLWQGEANKKPEVIYYPSGDQQKPDDGGNDDPGQDEPELPTEPVAAVLKCGADVSGEDAGAENVVSSRNEMVMNYADGEMTDILMIITNTFTDNEAASAAKPTYDSMKALMDAMFEAAGDEAAGFSSGVAQLDNVITYDVTMPASMLTAEGTSLDVVLPTKEDGSLDTSLDAVKSAIEADGYVCTVE